MLTLQIFESPDKAKLLADYTSRLHPDVGGGGLHFGTNRRGFATLEAPLIPLSLQESFMAYDWAGVPHAVVSNMAAGVAWEGRLEDISIVPGGISITGFGYWRSMYDVPYTALWSDKSVARWFELTEDNLSSFVPQFTTDNNNRLYIAPQKNSVFANTDSGFWAYKPPHNGDRQIVACSFDYTFVASTDWQIQLNRRQSDYTFQTTEWLLTGNGGTQTGSQTLTFSGCDALTFRLRTLAAITYSGETGDTYIKITNVRVKTTTSTSILASDIAAAIVSFVNSVNSSQIESTSGLIEATNTDLNDELYEDAYPAEILETLATNHGYEVGVWENRRLHFRTLGSQGKQWFVDVTQIVELQRSLEPMKNSVYAIYQDANNETKRTSVSTNSASQEKYGIVRREGISVRTTSQTQAEAHRNALLSDNKNLVLRAKIEFSRIYDQHGSEYPLWMLRAGDKVTMRNLPATLSTSIDNIRTFRIATTEYTAETNQMDIEPLESVPTVVTLIERATPGE